MVQNTAAQQAPEQATDNTAIRPFQVNVPEEELTELRRRINATRFPDKETVTDFSQGVRPRQFRNWRNTGEPSTTGAGLRRD